MKLNIEKLAHPLAVPFFSLASPQGGEGRGEEAKVFTDQIPSPQPSPRLGEERESGAVLKFALQRPTLVRFGLIGYSFFSLAMVFLAATLPLYGQTNVSETNASLKLLPPYGELPPTFFEQHRTSIVVVAIGVITLVAFGSGLIFRPKPKIIVPPEVEARQELERLRQRPEDGVVLSRVSQVTRSYFIAAFQLTKGEFTTAEFCREISGNEKIGAELAMAAADFLRDCDREKFSTKTGPAKLAAADRALNLVEHAEKRRAQQRQLAETQTEGRRA